MYYSSLLSINAIFMITIFLFYNMKPLFHIKIYRQWYIFLFNLLQFSLLVLPVTVFVIVLLLFNLSLIFLVNILNKYIQGEIRVLGTLKLCPYMNISYCFPNLMAQGSISGSPNFTYPWKFQLDTLGPCSSFLSQEFLLRVTHLYAQLVSIYQLYLWCTWSK